MTSPIRRLSFVLLVLVFLSACSGGSSDFEATSVIQTRVAEIISATLQSNGTVNQAISGTLTSMAPGLASQVTLIPEASPTSQDTPVPAVPVVTVSVQTNCRSGPGTGFEVLGVLDEGKSAEVVGRSLYNDNWIIKLPANPAVTCWLWAQYATVRGDTENVPVITPPATPTGQPVAPAASHSHQANLVPGLFFLDPGSPSCDQTFTVGIDVTNVGDKATTSTGKVTLEDMLVDGSVQASASAGFPILNPGQSLRVNLPLTILTAYNQTHRLKVTIDPSNAISESDDGDNLRTYDYTLLRGSCP